VGVIRFFCRRERVESERTRDEKGKNRKMGDVRPFGVQSWPGEKWSRKKTIVSKRGGVLRARAEVMFANWGLRLPERADDHFCTLKGAKGGNRFCGGKGKENIGEEGWRSKGEEKKTKGQNTFIATWSSKQEN